MRMSVLAAVVLAVSASAVAVADGPGPGTNAPKKATKRFNGNHQDALSSDPRRFKPADVVPLPEQVDLDMPSMPRGARTMAGIEWSVPETPAVVAPGQSRELGVEGLAGDIWVLQTAEAGGAIARWRAEVAKSHVTHGRRPDYPVVGRYVLEYVDGSRAEVPLRWAEGIENGLRRTFEPVSRFVADMGWAKVAWQGEIDFDRDLWPVVYATRILNPQPGKRIARVVFEAEESDWGRLAIFAVHADAQTPGGRYIFVSPDGDDGNPGTMERPLRTPQVAANTTEPGDTVILRGGQYRVEQPFIVRRSGAEGAWITYTGYPGETAIIRGDLLYTDNDKPDPEDIHGNYYAVPVGDEKIEMLASRTGALHIFKASWIRVQNLSVHESNFCGIATDNAHRRWAEAHPDDPGENSHDLEILHNRTWRTVQAGLGVFAGHGNPSRNVRVVGNQILNAYDFAHAQTTTGPGHQKQTRGCMRGERLRGGTRNSFGDENLDFHGVWNLEVGHNEVFAGGKEGIDLMIACRDARVHHNFVHENFVYPHFLGGKIGIYLDTRRHERNIEVDHNVVKRAGTGIRVNNEDGREGRDIRIHHNLSLDNFWNAFAVRGNSGGEHEVFNVDVFANTAFKNGYYDANTSPAGGFNISDTARLHDVTLAGNIACDGRDYAISIHRDTDLQNRAIRIEGNLVWPENLSSAKEGPQPAGPPHRQFVPHDGEGAVVAAPLFVDPENWNFYPREGSPAANVGAFPRVSGDANTWRAVPVLK